MLTLRTCNLPLLQARHLSQLAGGWLVFAENPAPDLPACIAQQKKSCDGEDDYQDLCCEREPASVGEEMAYYGNAQAGEACAKQQAHTEAKATAERTAVDRSPRFGRQLRFGYARRLQWLFYRVIFLLGLVLFASR